MENRDIIHEPKSHAERKGRKQREGGGNAETFKGKRTKGYYYGNKKEKMKRERKKREKNKNKKKEE